MCGITYALCAQLSKRNSTNFKEILLNILKLFINRTFFVILQWTKCFNLVSVKFVVPWKGIDIVRDAMCQIQKININRKSSIWGRFQNFFGEEKCGSVSGAEPPSPHKRLEILKAEVSKDTFAQLQCDAKLGIQLKMRNIPSFGAEFF